MFMLKGKTVLLGVTGSIAAYKMANLASALVKEGADVQVVMTKNAEKFICPVTFETLTGNPCYDDTFDRSGREHIPHISLPQKADVFLIAPATANVIGKLAHGIADDMLTTMALAANCKILVAPAMNTQMFRSPVVQDNLNQLRAYGFEIIDPAVGRLACASVGEGKLPEERVLMDYIRREICFPKDMAGLRVLVTAGPTREAIDPVRYITNHSGGKMGYAIAAVAAQRGAAVTLISGPTNLDAPLFVQTETVTTAAQMYHAVTQRLSDCDILIKAAAVADYTVEQVSAEKIKKQDGAFFLSLQRTQDILKQAGVCKRPNQVICGFSMETENLLENSAKKLAEKHCDMIVANNLKEPGAGFGGDTNKVTILTEDSMHSFGVMSKTEVAVQVLSQALAIYRRKNEVM